MWSFSDLPAIHIMADVKVHVQMSHHEDCGCTGWIPVFPSRKQWFRVLEKLLSLVEIVMHMVYRGVLMRG